MAKDWWNYSWNVAVGCTKVSTECEHCWAEKMARRLKAMGREEYQDVVTDAGRWTNRVHLVGDRLDAPLRLRKPRVIAVNLMGDSFHKDVPCEFIERMFETMQRANWHTYVVLSKRPGIMVGALNALAPFADKFQHVWLGTSAGNQDGADERRISMRTLAGYGWNTWVSSEPRIGAIDWRGWEFLKWLATGGESGTRARVMDPAWPMSDLLWTREHGIQWMFKQWGEWSPDGDAVDGGTPVMFTNGMSQPMFRIGKKNSGHVFTDGKVYRDVPWTLR